MMTTDETRTPWQLARLADCADPNALGSPGASFLRTVERSTLEALQDQPDEDRSDLAHEIADSAVPIYTHNRWQVFTDLCAWEVDISDLVRGGESTTDLAGFALYEVARTLFHALTEEYAQDCSCTPDPDTGDLYDADGFPCGHGA